MHVITFGTVDDFIEEIGHEKPRVVRIVVGEQIMRSYNSHAIEEFRVGVHARFIGATGTIYATMMPTGTVTKVNGRRTEPTQADADAIWESAHELRDQFIDAINARYPLADIDVRRGVIDIGDRVVSPAVWSMRDEVSQ
jgi:hypothetical protein